MKFWIFDVADYRTALSHPGPLPLGEGSRVRESGTMIQRVQFAHPAYD